MIQINVSIPKVEYARKKWLDAIATTQRQKALPELKKLFKKTVYGWSEKPDFGWSQTKSAGEISLRVYPTGPASDVWNLVNEGSPPHRIPKSGATYMRFRTGYRAATKPGTLQSGRKYRSGPYTVAYKITEHPGFLARKFTELIAEEYANNFAMEMQGAISETASR